jgi:uncharacterized protein YfaS (alpha-2-macroglobulin family)/tetratricopeptide (TPR) repeat protein
MKTWLLIFLGFWMTGFAHAQDVAALRKERDALMTKGRWKEALDFYREKLIDQNDPPAGDDLEQAVSCVRQLSVWGEFDALVELVVEKHPQHSQVLAEAGEAYLSIPHGGRWIAGEFERTGWYGWSGWHRGRGKSAQVDADGGERIDVGWRDRSQALRLFKRAVDHSPDESSRALAWGQLRAGLMRGANDAWKLQTLTPLDELPDWRDEGPEGGTEGAPWTGDGPVLYEVPASWEAAKNDGERWRFAASEQIRLNAQWKATTVLERARFSVSQFGSQTLRSGGWGAPSDPEAEKGILQVETLAEDETLAKTSAGIRRFKLPEEQHFIALYRSILGDAGLGAIAGDELVQAYLNRRQFDLARKVLEETLAKHGDTPAKSRAALLKQIIGNWGRFQPVETVAAGTKPVLPLEFRNATSVKLTAAPIRMEKVLADVKEHLKSNPHEVNYRRIQPGSIGWRLVNENPERYLDPVAATWRHDLKPEPKHRDTRAEIPMPLDRAGAWWVRADLGDGNTVFTVVWIVDQVLVRREVAGKLQWWVADAVTGAPVDGAKLDFFGYDIVPIDRKLPIGRRQEVKTKEFSRVTDAEGRTLVAKSEWDEGYQWMAVSRKEGRAPAFVGFEHFYSRGIDAETGVRDASYAVTDRPLYKAGDTLHAKFWLREVGYDGVNEGKFAGKTGRVVFTNGRDEEVIKLENQKADALGGLEVQTVIPKDAVLGVWSVRFEVAKHRAASTGFHVEEYRKPEYEVTVEAPTEPVRLGDSFTAKVKAAYFHGAPVRKAQVEITVKRGMVDEPWFPMGRWDWLYGRGTWWNSPEALWHPGWKTWGCFPPMPPWWERDRWTPDEVVLKQTVAIGEDGTASVTIDTATAKAIHGDLDAKYSIEARVTDASRREETANGEVVAAREPFRVVVWPVRGYAKPGDEIEVRAAAATLLGKPVTKAKGTLRLFKLSAGEGGAVKEDEVSSWPVTTDDAGELRQRFAVKEAGQYRLAAQLAAGDGPVVEGATILNLFGDKAGGDYRFGGVELVADKLEYQAGETAKLRINSDRPDANVWLFLRIQDGPGREAKRIVLDGKSREIELPLSRADMPNVFVEAVTVHGGKVHQAVRQILLPPESKMLEVALEPLAKRVKPQETSSLAVIVRDAEGKPFAGKAVLAIYDKSLEAITGGSNVGPIREAFWNWKHHYEEGRVRDSLPEPSGSLSRPKDKGMERLGYFSEVVTRRRALGGRGEALDEVGAMDAFAATPATAAVPMKSEVSQLREQTKTKLSKDGAGAVGVLPVVVRKDFADLLKWSGEVTLDANGRADVPLEFPDNLTTWKARVWVLGDGTKVGEGSAEIVTSKDLLVRLQAPRFLVEKDEAVLSAVVHNDHDAPKAVKVSLELEGGTAELVSGETKDVEIAAKGEARVDWRVKALREGDLIVRMKAEGADDGDAMERTLPVIVHGMLRQDAWSRVIEPGKESTTIAVEVPAERRPDQTKLTVRFSPTVAGAIVDAIPYLADYPYGCTEQTLNRFVPAVVAQKVVKDLGVNLGEIRTKRNNLNPQELGDARDRAAQWKRWQRNPVFDEDEMTKMVEKGVERLAGMQNSDGGWGWFSGYGEQSYPHTTAVVVHGLLVAKANGATIPDGMISRGVAWLVGSEKKEVAALKRYTDRVAAEKRGEKPKPSKQYEKAYADAMDAFVRYVLGEAGKDGPAMLDFLFRDRLKLPVYGECLLGLELHRKGDAARRDEAMATIAQFLKRDEENQTNFLELKNQSYWWYWYGSEVEAHAWYLKLLAAVKPNAPETRGLVKYLVNNRKHASYWNSTRDTAFAIEAIAAYLKASGETAPKMEVEVLLDGKSLRTVSIDRENLFAFDGTVTVEGKALEAGKHLVELRRKGEGALYANAYLEVFSLEDFLRKAGLEVKVERHLWKLTPLDEQTEVPDASGKVVKQRTEKFRREPLKDGDTVASGQRVEVELVLESKNDYEYLIFSDGKPAGFEAVDALSGYVPGVVSAYMEPRDKSVDFFLRALPRGRSQVSYQLRAEAPGYFHALPATAEGMYAPELRGNSDEIRLNVGESTISGPVETR